MAYNYRCSDKRNCGGRRTLKRLIEFYVNIPKCPRCKQTTLKIEPWTRQATIKRTCRCRGIKWPHRRGTFLNEYEFCDHADVDLGY